jgi:hypothetical protein
LLLTDLVDVVLCGCVDVLDLLFEGDISAPNGFNPTFSVLLRLEVVDVALARSIQSHGRLGGPPYPPACSGGASLGHPNPLLPGGCPLLPGLYPRADRRQVRRAQCNRLCWAAALLRIPMGTVALRRKASSPPPKAAEQAPWKIMTNGHPRLAARP